MLRQISDSSNKDIRKPGIPAITMDFYRQISQRLQRKKGIARPTRQDKYPAVNGIGLWHFQGGYGPEVL